MTKNKSSAKTPMTIEAAARIHSKEAKMGGGTVSKDSFTARSDRAAARNVLPTPKK
jgi:hypothetical protein